MIEKYNKLKEYYNSALNSNKVLTRWVSDLQSGMFINCVYCGHRYGPKAKTTVAMADALKEHIEQCPSHPMSKLRAESERLRAAVRQAVVMLSSLVNQDEQDEVPSDDKEKGGA